MPLSTHTFTVSDHSGSWPQPRNDNKGCWPCRYRMKGCKPGPEGRCKDCETFNIRCCGQGIDRPAGTDVKERVRALIKEWISNRANRGPSVPPLDVTRVMPSLLSSPVANPAIHQYSDGTPNSPSWAVIAQHDNTAGPAPSHNHESTIYQYTPLSSSPPLYYDDNVLSPSAGLYYPWDSFEAQPAGTFATVDQLQAPYDPIHGMPPPWGSYSGYI